MRKCGMGIKPDNACQFLTSSYGELHESCLAKQATWKVWKAVDEGAQCAAAQRLETAEECSRKGGVPLIPQKNGMRKARPVSGHTCKWLKAWSPFNGANQNPIPSLCPWVAKRAGVLHAG